MLKYMIILLFSTLLLAQNPFAYSALGDVIYNNADKIEKLQEIDIFKPYEKEIQKYLLDIKKVKAEGFNLEGGSSAQERKTYLNHLRELAKRNDFFKRLVESAYNTAIKTGDSKLFSAVINSGLLDTQRHKKEIIDYYFTHQEDLNTTGLIQSYLDEDAKLRAKKEAQQKRYKSKKQKFCLHNVIFVKDR